MSTAMGSQVCAALLVAAAASACIAPRDGAMVPIPTPAGWEDDLADQRSRKDAYFRESAESPLPAADVESFTGLDYWQPDPGFYFVGSIQRYREPTTFSIPTTSGSARPCERYGWVGFRIDGRLHTLQVYRLLDSSGPDGGPALLLPFADATSGSETYPAGRYVDLIGAAGGPWVLDFNQAYNPSCAYGEPERFACPVTPAENRLRVAIEAGERGFKHPEDAGG